jgi:hypothetical protein
LTKLDSTLRGDLIITKKIKSKTRRCIMTISKKLLPGVQGIPWHGGPIGPSDHLKTSLNESAWQNLKNRIARYLNSWEFVYKWGIEFFHLLFNSSLLPLVDNQDLV